MLLSLLRAARLLCEDSTPLLSRVSQVSINPCQVQNKLTRLPNKPVITIGLVELYVHLHNLERCLLLRHPYTGASLSISRGCHSSACQRCSTKAERHSRHIAECMLCQCKHLLASLNGMTCCSGQWYLSINNSDDQLPTQDRIRSDSCL